MPYRSESRWRRRLGPLAESIDRFLSGPRPSDPLYLSNRTTAQKLRRGTLIAAPVALFAALVWAALNNVLPTQSKPQPMPTNAEIAARTLPSLPKEIRIPANTDVQVTEATIRSSDGGRVVAGTARNNTDRAIRSAELLFDLTDDSGSQLGTVSTTLRDLEPNAAIPFQFAIKQSTAALVVVREVRTR